MKIRASTPECWYVQELFGEYAGYLDFTLSKGVHLRAC